MTKKKPEEEKKAGIDIGIGLGGIFEGLNNIIESVSKIAEEGKGVISKEGEIKGLGDKVRGVYGFTIRTLAGGESKVEPFGNIKKTPKGPVVEEIREPIVDIFDEKDQILVVTELPGVSEENISTDLKEDILTITAEQGERKYSKEVLLPAAAQPQSLSTSYKNGVLEIKLKKTETK